MINQSSHHKFLVSLALVYIRRPKMTREKEHKIQVKEFNIVDLFTSPSGGAGVSAGVMVTLMSMIEEVL